MYSNVSGYNIAGGAIAATGLGVGSAILAVLGVVFLAVGLYLILRPDSKDRP